MIAMIAMSQTTIRTAFRGAAAAVSFALFAMAPSAHALYVDVEGPTDPGTQTIDLGGNALTVVTEKHTIRVRSDEYGLRLNIDLDIKRIVFENGPIEIGRITFAEPGAGKAILIGPSGQITVGDGDFAPMLVSEIRQVSLSNKHGSDAIVGIDMVGNFPSVRPTNPIPEPGAALLFTAGLAAASAFSSRRQR